MNDQKQEMSKRREGLIAITGIHLKDFVTHNLPSVLRIRVERTSVNVETYIQNKDETSGDNIGEVKLLALQPKKWMCSGT